MKSIDLKLSPDDVRGALKSFWESNLETSERNGQLLVSLPLLYPDGMQVAISLKQVTASDVMVSDFGRTITRLEGEGIDLSLQRNTDLLSERTKAFELSKKGFELYKLIRFPIDGLDIQLFGEALVSISHLIYRHPTLDAQGTDGCKVTTSTKL